jgi:SOS response regulatory protein OraA/RecX
LSEFFIDWEQELLKNELEKIFRKLNKQGVMTPCSNISCSENLNFKEKQKIIQKLLAKWFWYGEIKEVMN